MGDQILRFVARLLVERVGDPRVRGVTLTGIRLSDDLRQAWVYFSVMDREQDLQAAKSGLESARGFVRREIGQGLALRYIPEIQFVYDPTLAKADRLEDIFRKMGSETEPGGEN